MEGRKSCNITTCYLTLEYFLFVYKSVYCAMSCYKSDTLESGLDYGEEVSLVVEGED